MVKSWSVVSDSTEAPNKPSLAQSMGIAAATSPAGIPLHEY